MMRRIHRGLSWLSCTLAVALSVGSGRIVAQPPDAGPRVQVVDVSDSREVDGSGSLTVVLGILGEPEGVKLGRTRLRAAADDAGGDLTGGQALRPADANNFGWQEVPSIGGGFALEAETKNPARRATKITKLAGEVEMLVPARDADATLVLSDWRKYLGQPLESGALKRSHITMRVLSAAEYKVLPKAERDDIGREVVGNNLLFLVSDPEHRLAAVVFQNPDGSGIEPDTTDYDDGFMLSFGAPLPPEARLKLLIATPRAVVKVPFDFSDIELP